MKGSQIYLRAVEPTDLDAIFKWENDPDNWLVSNTANPFSRHTLEQYVFSVHELMKDGQVRLMICLNTTEKAIGAIDLFELDNIHKRVGVGILVESEHRQKGVAGEALELVIDHCFSTLGLHQIFCNILADNEASIRLFKNKGFKESGIKEEWLWHDGSWKDEYLMQLIKKG